MSKFDDTSERYPLRRCNTCGRMIRPDKDGKANRHYRRSLSGRKELCLASGTNVLTFEELGWPRRKR